MLIRRKPLFWFGVALLVVGISFLIFPTYGTYCEGNQANNYNCAAYEIGVALGHFVKANDAAITALATVIIGIFTATIYSINKSQLRHSHKVERAYISGGGALQVREIDLGTQTTPGTIGGGTTAHLGTARIQTGNFVICINNYGKTAGELRWVGFGFCDAQNIPATPAYERRYWYDWVQPGDRGRPVFQIPIPTDRPATAVYGRFYYGDIFGGSHSCGFINEIGHGGSHPIVAPPAYTEERDEA